MSRSFTKLFSSITESTVWTECSDTRVVWVTMLAMADRDGCIWASVPGLAKRANVPLEACETALNAFLSPDKYSRTQDHEGRRIEPIDGGWRLLNYSKYRETQADDAQRARNAERQRRFRERHKDDVPRDTITVGNVTVTGNNPKAEAEVDKKKEPTAASPPRGAYPADFEAAWADYPARDGDNPKKQAYRAWRGREADGHTAEVMHAAVKRYAAWCKAGGKIGTETVMQAKRFFGPDKPFLNPWVVKGAAAPAQLSPEERAAIDLRERINNAWGEVTTAIRIKSHIGGKDAALIRQAVERIGGLDTLRRLPHRELHDKGSSFARAFSQLARGA